MVFHFPVLHFQRYIREFWAADIVYGIVPVLDVKGLCYWRARLKMTTCEVSLCSLAALCSHKHVSIIVLQSVSPA